LESVLLGLEFAQVERSGLAGALRGRNTCLGFSHETDYEGKVSGCVFLLGSDMLFW